MIIWLPVASGILAVCFWGVSFVAIKIALPQMKLETMIFLRQLLGTLTVAIIVGLRGEWQFPSRDNLPRIFLTSFVIFFSVFVSLAYNLNTRYAKIIIEE